MKSSYQSVKPYKTKDGSQIRELMHPAIHKNFLGVLNQSLAEATVYAGDKTHLHYHEKSEELYYIVSGKGEMTLGDQTLLVEPGDTICITPGTHHCIENTGDMDLVVLCTNSPPYDHDDTVLIQAS